MKENLLAALLAPVLLIPSVLSPRDAAAQAVPRMVLDKTTHDFGQLYEQAHYIATFEVENTGDAVLLIDKVSPSCGCTAAHFDKAISPGQKGRIVLDLDGTQVEGVFNKSASVFTNDRERARVVLTITGHEIPYLNVQPTGTITMHGRYGEAIQQTLTVSSNESDLDFKVRSVTSNIDDKITYVVEDGSSPGEYTVTLYKNPKLPSLSTYGSLFINSNSTRSPVTTVPVHVMTKSSITLTPAILNYGEVTFPETEGGEQPTTRSVVVTKAGGNFNIKDVTVSNPHYKVAVDAMAPGQKYRVDVTFTPPVRKTTPQTEAGEMIIHTDDPKDPIFKVKLLARSQ